MSFIYPKFLYFLFLLVVPIIIHLFYFRRFKKIYFSNVSLLKEIKKEKHTKNRLKNILVLFCRIFIFSSIIIAFAQPYIPYANNTSKEKENYISIYVDNSFSMNNESKEGNLLKIAKNKAREIVDEFGEKDKFQLITNEFKQKNQRFYTKDIFEKIIDEIEITPITRNISQVYERQKSFFSTYKNKNKFVFLISDFQKEISNFDNIKTNDSDLYKYIIPLIPVENNNIFIDSAWFEAPIFQMNMENDLFVRIKNQSNNEIEEATLTMSINGKQKSLANFHIKPQKEEIVKLVFTISDLDWNNVELKIKDYPIIFDDNYFFSFLVKKQIKILSINEESPNRYIKSVFDTDPYFILDNTNKNNIDFESIKNYDLLIINEIEKYQTALIQEIDKFINEGGNVLFVPSSKKLNKKSLVSYNKFLSTLGQTTFDKISNDTQFVDKIQMENVFFQGIFEFIPDNVSLPKVNRFYPSLSKSRTIEKTLLRLENGDNFLSIMQRGQGNLFVLSTALNPEWTNFVRHSIYVPVMYKIATYSMQKNSMAYNIGENSIIKIPNNENIVLIIENGKMSFIPEQKIIGGELNIFVKDEIEEAGIYELKDNKEKQKIANLSFNYNRKESNIETLDKQELKDISDNQKFSLIGDLYDTKISEVVSSIQIGKSIWKFFILIAIIFIIAEILIIRFVRL